MSLICSRLEGASGYEFNMESLSAYLKSMKEKASAPFYNVQIFKYEVKTKNDKEKDFTIFWVQRSKLTVGRSFPSR